MYGVDDCAGGLAAPPHLVRLRSSSTTEHLWLQAQQHAAAAAAMAAAAATMSSTASSGSAGSSSADWGSDYFWEADCGRGLDREMEEVLETGSHGRRAKSVRHCAPFPWFLRADRAAFALGS